MGCLRSRTERQKWKDLMPAEKMRVVELCGIRRVKLDLALKAKKEKETLIASGAGIPQGELTTKVKVKVKVVKSELASKESEDQEGSLDLF